MSDLMRIALLGAGQLGGSFALALQAGDVHITAYDTIAAHAETLQKMGAVQDVSNSIAQAVSGADVIVLASPLRSYPALAAEMAPHVKAGVIVTDLGSVKGSMLKLQPVLPTAHIVPAHPIAGSEKSGPEVARSDLFRDRLCILTPDDGTNPEALAAVETLWHVAGAETLNMPADVHDHVYAYVSHLPHYIAFASASYYFTIGAKIGSDDAALGQFLRIAHSNPRMWTDIALENREALLPALATYIAVLDHFATELRAGEKQEADAATTAKALLPRLLASSLISSVSLYEKQSGMDLRSFGGAGMRDIIAPAMTAPEGDMEAISNASHMMANHLEAMVKSMRTLESAIGAEDEAQVFLLLSTAAERAQSLFTARQ